MALASQMRLEAAPGLTLAVFARDCRNYMFGAIAHKANENAPPKVAFTAPSHINCYPCKRAATIKAHWAFMPPDGQSPKAHHLRVEVKGTQYIIFSRAQEEKKREIEEEEEKRREEKEAR